MNWPTCLRGASGGEMGVGLGHRPRPSQSRASGCGYSPPSVSQTEVKVSEPVGFGT